MSIFDKDTFTLKELCYMFTKIQNSDEINNIIQCYLYFSSNNENYRKFLKKTRMDKGHIFINNDKYINFREILQTFDIEFCKLVITIHTQSKNYDVCISWKDFDDKMKMKNITKEDLKDYSLKGSLS